MKKYQYLGGKTMLKLFDEFDLEINKVKLNDDLRVYSDDTGGGSGGLACSQSNCCPTMSVTCLTAC